MATNEITGDRLVSKAVTHNYRQGWDMIFGKKVPSFHKNGDSPKDGWVFSFGSNLAGRHGAGAALAAVKHYGAVYGKGIGHYGNSYAIPTKDENIETLSLDVIEWYVVDFNRYVESHPELRFFVTAIGTQLAGYTHADIAPMFKGFSNCSFPEEWRGLIQEV